MAAIAAPLALLVALAAVKGLIGVDEVTVEVTSVIPVAAAAYAMACAVIASRSGPPNMRRLWSVMVVAMAGCLGGNVIWACRDFIALPPPGASIADFLYLASAVLIAVAMLLFPVEPVLRLRLRGALEGIAAGLCLFLLAWVLVLNAVFDSYRSDLSVLTFAFVYPIICLVSLAIAIGLLIGAEPSQRRVLWILTVSIATLTVANGA